MKKILFLLSLSFCISFSVNAQKSAKLKKGVISIDKVPFLNYDCEWIYSDNCMIRNLNGDKVIISKSYFLEKKYIPNSGHYVNVYYHHIEFLGTEYTMFVVDYLSEFYLNMYKSEIFNSDGTYNLEKLKDFVHLYGVDEPNVVHVD